jgi:hypothetical protein
MKILLAIRGAGKDNRAVAIQRNGRRTGRNRRNSYEINHKNAGFSRVFAVFSVATGSEIHHNLSGRRFPAPPGGSRLRALAILRGDGENPRSSRAIPLRAQNFRAAARHDQ